MMAKIEVPLAIGIEIGLGWGVSAKTFLDLHPKIKLISVDIQTDLEARVALQRAYPKQFVFVPRDAMPFLKNLDVIKCQWLYIDGGHEYDEVKRDIEIFEPMLVPGGVIAFDDFNNANPKYPYPGVKQAVDEFFSREGHRFKGFTAIHLSETGPVCAVKKEW